ncbi:MFS transporter [Microbispora catharanthi]|uniref:MFS transporter n=1 Tax=Microbispora catharanthi TaxID=1712871 RepID=A0A5N6BLB9_9ACTN|nr:MFS transporter [Microbispora catharanthi]KAB8180609.1 MFS transporter [Microbispora catharanthi]
MTVLPPARPHAGTKFAGIAAGSFMIGLDASVLNVALPDMRRELHASAASLPWTVDAYTVVLAGLLLASGSIADRFGPRRVYRVALAGFALASLVCAAAPSAGVLIAGRALLGAPAAGLVPASMALLAALYPDPDHRSRKIGALVSISGLGIVGGPVLGGALVAAGGWRLVFLVNLPVAVLTLLASGGLSDHRGGTPRPLDLAGLLLSVAGLTALTFGLVDAGTSGWVRPLPLGALTAAAVAFGVFSVVQRRTRAPVLPPALTALARVRTDLAVAVVSQLVFYGLLFTLTQWMVRDVSPLRAGLSFLPMTVPVIFIPMVTGRLVVRFGARPVMLAGLVLDLLGGLLLTMGSTSTWAIVAVQVLIGAGSPLAIPACIADMSAAVPLELAATGQGALNAARQAGTAIGVAVFGTLSALSTTGIVLAAFAALTVAVVSLNRLPRRAAPGHLRARLTPNPR